MTGYTQCVGVSVRMTVCPHDDGVAMRMTVRGVVIKTTVVVLSVMVSPLG